MDGRHGKTGERKQLLIFSPVSHRLTLFLLVRWLHKISPIFTLKRTEMAPTICHYVFEGTRECLYYFDADNFVENHEDSNFGRGKYKGLCFNSHSNEIYLANYWWVNQYKQHHTNQVLRCWINEVSHNPHSPLLKWERNWGRNCVRHLFLGSLLSMRRTAMANSPRSLCQPLPPNFLLFRKGELFFLSPFLCFVSKGAHPT